MTQGKEAPNGPPGSPRRSRDPDVGSPASPPRLNSDEGSNVRARLCAELAAIARAEEEAAAELNARTLYWQCKPAAAVGHMEAAKALRRRAHLLERGLASTGSAGGRPTGREQ